MAAQRQLFYKMQFIAMWQRNAFIGCSRSAEISDDQVVWKVSGCDVSAIAYVRKAEGRAALPACGLREIDDEQVGRALDLLLAGGDDDPPASFSGPEQFIAALRSRQYRGAAVIAEPTAYLNRDGDILRAELRILKGGVGAGYCMRVDHQGQLRRTHNLGAATDAHRLNVTFEGGMVRIEHWQRFRLASATDMHGRFGEGTEAPLGWIKLTYELAADGSSQAHAACSYIPSCCFYRDYVRVFRRDMLLATKAEVQRVVRPRRETDYGTTWTTIDTSTGQLHASVTERA